MPVFNLTSLSSHKSWGVLFFLLCVTTVGWSQNNVSIGTTEVNSKAVLWLKGNGSNQGLLLPVVSNRVSFTGLTTSERGMMVYDLSDNRVYYWTGNDWAAASGGSGGGTDQTLTLNGNIFTLSGTTPSNVSLSATTPANGQVLVWNQAQSRWEAITAAGDVTGPYSNLTVAKLKGKDLPAALPASAQALVYNGTAWTFQAISGTDSQSLSLTGATLAISGGNSVTLPDASGTNEFQNISTAGTGTAAAGDAFDVNISSGVGFKIKEGSNIQIDNASNVLTISSVAGGVGTVTNVTATAPLSVTNPTTVPALSITQANTTTSGFLTSADWNTFNNKLGATVLTTQGDLLFHNGTTSTRLPRGSNGQVLLSTATGIQWSPLPGGGDMLKTTYDVNADNIVDAAASVNYPSQAVNTVLAAPSGAAGTPTFRLLAAADIPSLDAAKISTGTFPVGRGGTGLTTAPTNGQVLIGNGTGYTLSTLTQGSGVTITNASGTITIASTGLSNPLTTTGDIIYGVGTTPTRLGGAAGFLKSTGLAAPAWSPVNLASPDVTGALPVTSGGTGGTTQALARTGLGLGGLAILNAVTSAEIATDAVTSAEIADLSIVNADVNATAAIAGTKIAPNFGAQLVQGTGNVFSGEQMGARFAVSSALVTYGMVGEANATGTTSYGVFGRSTGATSNSHGVYGMTLSTSPNNYGVYGVAQGAGTNNFGVYGEATNGGTNNWAGYFNGRTSILGALNVGGATTFGTDGQVLTSSGNGAAPRWETPATGGFSTANRVPRGDGTGMIASNIYDNGSGNVGIGIPNPLASLAVARGTGTNGTASFAGTDGYTTHFNYSTAENTYIRAGKAGAYVTINDSHSGNVYLVDGGGKVAVDVATPLAKLHAQEPLSSGIGLYGASSFSGTTNGTGVYGIATNSPGFGYGGRFTGGYAGVYGFGDGTTFASITYGVYGLATGSTGTRYGVYGEASGGSLNYAGYFNGNVFTTGSYLPSDEKLKYGIRSFDESSVDLLKKVAIKSYQYHQEGDFKNMALPQGNQVGLLAGDLEKIFPQLVKETAQDLNSLEQGSGTHQENIVYFKAVNYAGLVPYLVKAIQEQQNSIESLQLRVKELEEKTKNVNEVFAQLEEIKKEMETYRTILGAQASNKD